MADFEPDSDGFYSVLSDDEDGFKSFDEENDDKFFEMKSILPAGEHQESSQEAQNLKESNLQPSFNEAESHTLSPTTTTWLVDNLDRFFLTIASGLDVLETIGKEAYDALTSKDEVYDRRRFLLDKSKNLSDILREARAQSYSDTNDSGLTRISVHPRPGHEQDDLDGTNTNFVALFERAEGMVHLEGLEMLSAYYKKQNLSLKFNSAFDDHVAKFCADGVSECTTEEFVCEIEKCTLGIGLSYDAEDVLQADEEMRQMLMQKQEHVEAGNEVFVREMHEAAILSFAKLTAHSIQAFHKIAQLMFIASELPDVEFLFSFTYILCRRLSFYAGGYSNLLNLAESSKTVDNVMTNISFEATNGCHYLKEALMLLRPFFTS